MADWLDLSKQAFEASTTYVDQNYRGDWDYSIKAFHNEHSSDSRYNFEEYKKRSRIFRPKTRSIIRKNEAAGAVALFSNMDVVDMSPGNPDDITNVASAECMKYIVEYRLTRTIPAFPLVMGALQDAQVQGAVCSYNYWKYQKRSDGTKVKDQPCIELRPIENIRLDPGADWLDPVNSTPYFADIIPMYVCDVRAMMSNDNDKTAEPKWKSFEDSVIMRARPQAMDATRKARQQGQLPEDETTGIKDFDIVHVLRWCMRNSQGEDYCYYTLGTEELLSDPRPIEEIYFHGRRPYVIGCAIIETHRPLKPSLPVITRPIQEEANHIANTRLDNVYLALYKRWLVARGRQVDTSALVRGAPGAVVMMSDPKNDVVESNWPDVTSSAYVEQDRLNADFDDLAGNFSPNTRFANTASNDTLGGTKIAAQGAGVMTDYLLRTFIETWWEPTLRQLVMLEQYYETDDVILGVCAQKARLFPKFGISRMTDMMLMNEVNVSVNVGMGASNPNERFQKFMVATQAAIQLAGSAPPSFNVQEGIKEIYSNAGYRDGARFFNAEVDPRLIQAAKTIQQLQGALKGKQMELMVSTRVDQEKIASNEKIATAKIAVDQSRINGDIQIRQAELAVEAARVELEQLKLRIEVAGMEAEHKAQMITLQSEVEQAHLKLEAERQKVAGQAMKMAAEIEKTQLELSTIRKGEENESRIGQVADGVTKSMSEVVSEIMQIKAALESTASGMGTMNRGLGAMVGVMMQPKKTAKGFKLKKNGKKTEGVVIEFDDGSVEEMVVQ